MEIGSLVQLIGMGKPIWFKWVNNSCESISSGFSLFAKIHVYRSLLYKGQVADVDPAIERVKYVTKASFSIMRLFFSVTHLNFLIWSLGIVEIKCIFGHCRLVSVMHYFTAFHSLFIQTRNN